MGFTSFDFDFHFLNEKNKPMSFRKKHGTITEEALILDKQELYYHQIQEVIRFRERLSFVIKAGAKSNLTEYHIPHASYFMIRVDNETAFDIKSLIDRQYTAIQAKEHLHELEEKEEAHNFRSMICPQCQSTIDLSYVRPSKFIFCKHCDALFNEHGNYTDLEDYKVCHVCNYYNRMQVTPKIEVYFLGKDEKKWSLKSVYQCDSCTSRDLKKRFWKNLPFVIGAVGDFFAKNQIETDIDSTFDQLTKANRLSYEGKVNEAIEIFETMMIYTTDQPGVLYNVGKAYLDAGLLMLSNKDNPEAFAKAQPLFQNAVKWLSRSLKLCANYLPTIELFQAHSAIAYEIEQEDTSA